MIRLTLILLLSVLFLLPFALAQDSLTTSQSASENPLGDYLSDLEEMGLTLSGWEGGRAAADSWFFGSYAMLILRNSGKSDDQPFTGFETVVPALWKDFKYLTPRYLVELAGGILSHEQLMAISQEASFKSNRPEAQFIKVVAGFSYLRMLNGTVGDSLFNTIVKATMASTKDPTELTDIIIDQVRQHCGAEMGQQFYLALSSGSWMDAAISKVRKKNDSTAVFIDQKGLWSFPLDVLMISSSGDSTYYTFGIDQGQPLRVAGRDYDRIILDPDHKLAEFYRYNNKWPRVRDNIYIQPFIALPDWESIRIVVSPGSWTDWDGDKRYALKLSSGFGLDLWPAYPSDYRHRTTLELNAHEPMDSSKNWGARISYGHPVSLQKRLFVNLRAHDYDDWSGFSIGLTRYIGKQRFLIEGPRLLYQRVSLQLEQDSYGDPQVWQCAQAIQVLKADYTGLSLTRYGDRLFLYLRSAIGEGPQGSFSIAKAQVDLSGVFWNWLVGGVHFVSGFQSNTTPSPYQFTHTYAWQDNLAALPSFRGQSKIDQRPNNYLGLSVSGGYWFSWYQAKIFGSSMLYDETGVMLRQVKPRYAAGFGFEHKSLFTVGLYFPIWQSHPLEDEEPWAWRYQWRLSWNL